MLLVRLVVDRAKIEREITILGARPRHFILRVAAVCSGEDGRGAVRGIVASLSDITRQHELQQTKNDVMALVSHEMRTPLTAIQGMSELLAQFEVDPERRPRNEPRDSRRGQAADPHDQPVSRHHSPRIRDDCLAAFGGADRSTRGAHAC